MAPRTLPPKLFADNLFLPIPDCDTRNLLEEALKLLDFEPQILTRIETDQDHLAKKKKRLRKEDKRYMESMTLPLPEIDLDAPPIVADELELEEGRPRMDPEVVFMFMTLRGYYASLCSRKAIDRLRDSLVVNSCLQSRGLTLPGVSTIIDNLNAISNKTRDFILASQLKMILSEELDDFDTIIGDSTAVKANSCWPTDAGVLVKLLNRAFHLSQKMEKFGLPNLPLWHLPSWLKDMKKIHFEINTCGGKAHSKKTRKKAYRRLLEKSMKMANYLNGALVKSRNSYDPSTFPPSRREKVDRLYRIMEEDVVSALEVLSYTRDRIEHDLVLPSGEKVLSTSDPDAAFITKGNRDSVIGYKPQLARSGNGFVCGLIIPPGNAADQTQLFPLVKEVIKNTGVTPSLASFDDGYASGPDRLKVLELGVKDVSISGGKGKKLTDEDAWESLLYQEARRNRSAVESIMFVLKYVYEFGRLRRRGLKEVRAEQMEKVIAYNFLRMSDVRKARERKKQKEAA